MLTFVSPKTAVSRTQPNVRNGSKADIPLMSHLGGKRTLARPCGQLRVLRISRRKIQNTPTDETSHMTARKIRKLIIGWSDRSEVTDERLSLFCCIAAKMSSPCCVAAKMERCPRVAARMGGKRT